MHTVVPRAASAWATRVGLKWRLACAGLFLVHLSQATEKPKCPPAGPNWVSVTVDASSSPQLALKLLEHLQAEMAPHKIVVCPGIVHGAAAPLADIHIVHPSSNSVGIEVQVEDAVTEKKVARNLDLGNLPKDAHALTIALGAAELLRASWAEIKLQRGTLNVRDAPSSVRDTVDDSLVQSSSRSELALRIAGEEFARGLRQAGVDAAGAFALSTPFWLTFRLGARQSFSVHAADGSIRANSWIVGTGMRLRLNTAASKANVGVTLHLDCERLQFFAEPRAGASATTLAGTGILGSLGVYGGIALVSSVQIETEIDGGVVFKGVSAWDGDRSVVAMNGPWVGASLGLSVRTW